MQCSVKQITLSEIAISNSHKPELPRGEDNTQLITTSKKTTVVLRSLVIENYTGQTAPDTASGIESLTRRE